MKLLIAEDDALTLRILEKYLLDLGYEVITAKTGLQAWEIFRKEDIGLVITDWMMPEMNGIELIQNIRSHNCNHYTYIVLLTAKEKKSEIVEGIMVGADDYIVKPFDRDELAVRIRAGSRIIGLQQKLYDANTKLERLASFDPLTGLLNRRAMAQRIESMINGGCESQTVMSIMADIDHFKKVNDTYGHEVGDIVLQRIARLLQCTFGKSGMAARIGGEEFFILHGADDRSKSLEIVEATRREIEDIAFEAAPEKRFGVTCSFGVFFTPAEKCNEFHTCMKKSDDALYRAKEQGRNRVVIADPEEEKTSGSHEPARNTAME